MAQTDRISAAALDSIGQQIVGAVESMSAKMVSEEFASMTVGKTLSLWRIKPEALTALVAGADPNELSDWASPVERWHHQLRFHSENRGYARSKAAPTEPGEIELRELSVSEEAIKIEEAIELVEQELQTHPEKYGLPIPYDPLLRLLEVPSRRVTALILFDEPHDDLRLLMVEAPPGNDRLQPGTLLESVEFLTHLAAQPRPRGII